MTSADLFDHRRDKLIESEQPLAARMRPRTLEEYIGQDHIVGPGRLLRRAIQADQLSSVIFYGPPGTGKTTLARVIANTTSAHFIAINAVLAGVKDIREATEVAQNQRGMYGRKTILFVDEVHRFNKAQQDALLPWVENGTVILIGATTENPYFSVNRPLVSRSRIFQLKPLTEDDLYGIAHQALADRERGYGKLNVQIDEDALAHLVNVANGDARALLNALELAVETTPPTTSEQSSEHAPRGTHHVSRVSPDEPSAIGDQPSAISRPPVIRVTLAVAEESIQRRAVLYDKEGDYHFDTISAYIKSLRGSDPDAALYWLAKMVYAGEDPRFIFRRMLIFAGEDVGLADPNALRVAVAAAEAFDRVGLPEGRFHLTTATLYLATAPKSNSAMGFFDALGVVEQEREADVPNHLRDANRDKEGFGHGEGYLYPHAYRDHWVAQQYLPEAMQGKVFYKPGDQGYEAQIRLTVVRRREAQLAAMIEGEGIGPPEVLTFTGNLAARPRPVAAADRQRRGPTACQRARPCAGCGADTTPLPAAGSQRRQRPADLGSAAARAGGRPGGVGARAAGRRRAAPAGGAAARHRTAAHPDRRHRRPARPACRPRGAANRLAAVRRDRRPQCVDAPRRQGSRGGHARLAAGSGRRCQPRRDRAGSNAAAPQAGRSDAAGRGSGAAGGGRRGSHLHPARRSDGQLERGRPAGSFCGRGAGCHGREPARGERGAGDRGCAGALADAERGRWPGTP
ncbi:MAG: AAA family ATPase [Caldilineales bacterium]